MKIKIKRVTFIFSPIHNLFRKTHRTYVFIKKKFHHYIVFIIHNYFHHRHLYRGHSFICCCCFLFFEFCLLKQKEGNEATRIKMVFTFQLKCLFWNIWNDQIFGECFNGLDATHFFLLQWQLNNMEVLIQIRNFI